VITGENIRSESSLHCLKKIIPNEMKSSEDDRCDYNDPEVWDFPSWHFTEQGLYLGAIFARAARNCDDPEWSIIPYKAIKTAVEPR